MAQRTGGKEPQTTLHPFTSYIMIQLLNTTQRVTEDEEHHPTPLRPPPPNKPSTAGNRSGIYSRSIRSVICVGEDLCPPGPVVPEPGAPGALGARGGPWGPGGPGPGGCSPPHRALLPMQVLEPG